LTKNILSIKNYIFIMITFGIQGIRYFDDVNKAGIFTKKALELEWTFNICNGLYYKLLKAGHKAKFYHGDKECWEIHLNDPSIKSGGIDDKFADDVDLFFIATHGNRDDQDKPLLAYNVKKDEWISYGKNWKLGNKLLKWLFIHSCLQINLKNVIACIDMFDKLHGICASYDLLYSPEESGRDLGEYLTDGDYTVGEAWIESQSDWNPFHDNHSIVVCANDKRSYDDKGNLIKIFSTLNLDWLSPSGFKTREIPRSEIVGLHYMWVE
jgi:hypothetical protein